MDEILSSDFSVNDFPASPDNATPEQAPAPDTQIQAADPAPKEKLIKAKRASGLPRMTKALRSRGMNAKKRPLGKPKLPHGRCRVQMSVRVMPDTLAALNKLGEKNPGWAVDKLVRMAKDAKLFKIPVDMF